MKPHANGIPSAIAFKIIDVSQTCSEGYMRALSENFSTDEERKIGSACATAAANTGVFILEALGFSKKEIRDMLSAYRSSEAG